MRKIDPKFKNLQKIIQSEIKIPEYQRAYEWNSSMAENLVLSLWEMFLETIKPVKKLTELSDVDFKSELQTQFDDREVFYMGQIVKQGDEVVDGQQRLTTIMILIKAIADICSESNVGMDKIYTNLWLPGTENDFALKSSYVDRVFSERIFSKDNLFVLSKKNKDFKKSEENSKLLKSNWFKNYQSIYKLLLDLTAKYQNQKLNTCQLLSNFIVFIKEKVWVTLTEIDSIEDAILFFEIMNSKSQPLTPADLIKNRFIKNQQNKAIAADKWNKIVIDLFEEGDLSKFIRYVYICKYGYISSKDLFTKAAEKAIVDDMYEYLNAYKMIAGLIDTDNITNDAQLNFIFNVGPRESLTPILLEIFKTVSDHKKRTELLGFLVNFSYKYFFVNGFKANAYSPYVHQICGKIANGVERPLNKLLEIYQDQINTLSGDDVKNYNDVKMGFDISDSSAARKFAKSLYPLLFVKMNNNYDKKEIELKKIGISSMDIEHIYPQSPEGDVWPILKDENSIWHIGNLLPISSSKNRAAKNSSFEIKFKYYQGKVTSKGEIPTDEEKDQLNPSTFFKKLFIDVVDSPSEKMRWNDEQILKRGEKIRELMEQEDILYFNSGNK